MSRYRSALATLFLAPPFLLLACQPTLSATVSNTKAVEENNSLGVEFDGPIPDDAIQDYVWCYDKVRNSDGTTGYGHLPGANPNYDYEGSSDEYVTTLCFRTWAEVITHDTNGEITPPENATAEDWAAALQEHSDLVTQGELKENSD